ncbi:MAG: M20/M25/M40 family metallo-hydrolase [Terriglobia bacterium]
MTRALVDIDSVTGHEGACAEFLRTTLDARGFAVELQPVSPGRSNVLAFCGTPEVVLSTHFDTVPPFFPAREDAEWIYGRGSCDAKGIVAAQVTAAGRLAAEGVRDFGLVFLVGEETSSDGAQVANQSPRGARYIINGEPTDNKLAIATKGCLQLHVRTHGRAAHSAYPELGESAIDRLLDVLADFRHLPLPRDFVLGISTANIGVISGGLAANVIPDEAQARILIRTVTDSADLRRQISSLLAGRCELEFVKDTPVMRMERLDGFETCAVAFTTDLPSLSRWGRPLLLGPGSIAVAHTDHECVRKEDLLRAVDLYCELVKRLKKTMNRSQESGDTSQHTTE